MSVESLHSDRFDNTIWRTIFSTWTKTSCILFNIDTIFSRYPYQELNQSIYLRTRYKLDIIVSQERDTYGTKIISIRMSSLDKITSFSSFIYCSIFSYNIVISYISPSPRTSMVCIDRPENGHIIRLCL